MKRTSLIMCALMVSLISVPLAFSMEPVEKVEQQKPVAAIERVKHYFNLHNFCWRMGVLFSDESAQSKDDSKLTKGIIAASINALRLENLPVSVKRNQGKPDKYVTASKYFNCDDLKKLLVRISNDYFKNDEDESTKALRYVKSLKKCLNMNAVEKDLGAVEFLNLKESFDNAIKYYEGKPVSIDDCLSLEKFPAFFGIEMDSHCRLKSLKKVINLFLQRQPIDKRSILKCFKFTPLLEWMGMEEKEIAKLEQSLCGIIAFGVDFAKQDDAAFNAILGFFAEYGKTKEKVSTTEQAEEVEEDAIEAEEQAGEDNDSQKSNESDASSNS